MKFKLFFTILPLIILLYVFLIKDRLDTANGIGGGSYDLTKLYTLVILGIYLLIFNLVLVVQDARHNLLFLLFGMAQLIAVAVIFIRTL